MRLLVSCDSFAFLRSQSSTDALAWQPLAFVSAALLSGRAAWGVVWRLPSMAETHSASRRLKILSSWARPYFLYLVNTLPDSLLLVLETSYRLLGSNIAFEVTVDTNCSPVQSLFLSLPLFELQFYGLQCREGTKIPLPHRPSICIWSPICYPTCSRSCIDIQHRYLAAE